MNRSTTHASFTIERIYSAAPERDFRAGGAERVAGRWADGSVTDYRSRYEEIIPSERIIFTYHMLLNDIPISVSLTTVEFKPVAGGTMLLFTEQLTCLDDYHDDGAAGREHGTRLHLERIAEWLNG
jgi:uncharacterized protein YndB with AHSA1/START domain